MHGGLEWRDVTCPYCGERITLAVDSSAGAQEYTEDCQVCCRPMQVWAGAEGELRLRREDEA